MVKKRRTQRNVPRNYEANLQLSCDTKRRQIALINHHQGDNLMIGLQSQLRRKKREKYRQFSKENRESLFSKLSPLEIKSLIFFVPAILSSIIS